MSDLWAARELDGGLSLFNCKPWFDNVYMMGWACPGEKFDEEDGITFNNINLSLTFEESPVRVKLVLMEVDDE